MKSLSMKNKISVILIFVFTMTAHAMNLQRQESPKVRRDAAVDTILKDYNRGLVHTLAASSITAGTVYAGTRTLPVLSDYSISSAAWTGAHVGVLTHMVHATNTFSRLSGLIPLPNTKINGIDELTLGVLLSIAALNSGSYILALNNSNTTSDINCAFVVTTMWSTFFGLGYASVMHNEIHELATQIKSMPVSDLGPNDDNYLCSIG